MTNAVGYFVFTMSRVQTCRFAIRVFPPSLRAHRIWPQTIPFTSFISHNTLTTHSTLCTPSY